MQCDFHRGEELIVKIGYARVSTKTQQDSLQNQQAQLKGVGCEKIYAEVVSGMKAKRPQLARALDYAREGDTLIVTRLDRLGRSTLDTLKTLQSIDEKGVRVQALDLDLDTQTPAGRLVISVIASLAQWERDLMVERTKEGLAHARSQGRYGGRPAALTSEQKKAVRSALKDGMSAISVAKSFGVSRSTIERVKREGA